MTKKIAVFVFLSAFTLSACSHSPVTEQEGDSNAGTSGRNDSAAEQKNLVIDETNTGGEDAEGFVKLPGEPSRGNGDYYITEEVCQQFTKKYMEGLLGKTILEAKPSYAELANCQYSLDKANQFGQAPNVLLSLSFLPIANQIKGHESMKRTVAKDPSIPMDNYVVRQENGLVNEIYLVLGSNKFLSINRSSGKVISEEELLSLAQKLGEKIKGFK